MNPSVLFVFILSILLGVLRAADLAFGTDAVTGLCVVGSVWWRYLALGIVVLAAVLVGRTQPSHSEAVRSRRPLAGILAFVGAVCFLAAAGAQIALGAASGLGGFVRCILECLCSAWLSTMGRCWLSPNEWRCGRRLRHWCFWQRWPGHCMSRSRAMAKHCAQPGLPHLHFACAGSCPMYWF